MIHPDPPVAVAYPRYASVVKGENLTLICNTTGIPPPSIEWTKVGDSTVLSQKQLLTLYNVQRSGPLNVIIQYRCTAKNGIGIPASSTADVQVLGKYIPLNASMRSKRLARKVHFAGHTSIGVVSIVKWSKFIYLPK